MKYFLTILSVTLLFSQKIDSKNFTFGKRDNLYRVWVYFVDKADSDKHDISKKAMDRREKSNVASNHLWLDLNVSPTYKNQITNLGIEIKNESRWLNAVSIICQKTDLKKIAELSCVKKIEPVIGYKKETFQNELENSSNTRDLDYGNAQAQVEQINVHELHNAGYTGEGVRILVMDTGFDLTHNSMININVIEQWDVINNDNQTANETDDEANNGQDNHGTAVLSTIAANAPGELIGVAFDAEFLLAKTEDVSQEIQQEEDNYVAGLEWGEANGADVVTTSLGYLDWYDYEDMDGNTAVTTNAVDIAVGLGMVCVTAAGNSGNDSWYYIIAPADADSVIAVGAVRENGVIASFSSHGPTFDGRIKPEVCARGSYTWCVSPNSTTTYTQLSGTSLACPLVGGAVALVRQAKPEWSAMEVREAVMMTASQSSEPDNSYGYGIMNAALAIEYDHTASIGNDNSIPNSFYIINTYPNPFNPSLTIDISGVPGSSITVDVFTVNGKFIENLYSGVLFQTNQKLYWQALNISSGIYFIRSTINQSVQYQKVTFLK
ncbi:MAG: S8 family serine peptidase [Candidatus Marinimicrobia bacterium]|nr:S8 family serine peptidase [Candidatus Neomarinimicrobiota bacterium]